MQALEAFYSDGVGDLRKQLSEKSSIWLGPWKHPKNIVGRLYDLRSSYVHGSSKLEYWNAQLKSWEEDEKLMTEMEAGTFFAVRLLVATIQKCIFSDVYDVRWSYSVETSS